MAGKIYVYYVFDLIVIIDDHVIKHIQKHLQKKCFHREAGGQLFARVRCDKWHIKIATGPRKNDIRGRFSFWPNRNSEQAEIFENHAQGFEYVGDWHTHPVASPTPSNPDIDSMAIIVSKSNHHFPGFLMIIAGTDFPENMWISFHLINGSYKRATLKSVRSSSI